MDILYGEYKPTVRSYMRDDDCRPCCISPKEWERRKACKKRDAEIEGEKESEGRERRREELYNMLESSNVVRNFDYTYLPLFDVVNGGINEAVKNYRKRDNDGKGLAVIFNGDNSLEKIFSEDRELAFFCDLVSEYECQSITFYTLSMFDNRINHLIQKRIRVLGKLRGLHKDLKINFMLDQFCIRTKDIEDLIKAVNPDMLYLVVKSYEAPTRENDVDRIFKRGVVYAERVGIAYENGFEKTQANTVMQMMLRAMDKYKYKSFLFLNKGHIVNLNDNHEVLDFIEGPYDKPPAKKTVQDLTDEPDAKETESSDSEDESSCSTQEERKDQTLLGRFMNFIMKRDNEQA